MDPFLSSAIRKCQDRLSAPWAGEANLVGTMIDRQVVRIAGVGDHTDDAILVFLQAIRNASMSSSVFGSMWKTIRSDKTVDLWLYDHNEQWRSVSFEVQFHQVFPIEDLYMAVSTFVPFGVNGDRTHYVPEQSTAYMRSTQTLRAIVSMQARRLVRESVQGMDASEHSQASSRTMDLVQRHSLGSTDTRSRRSSSSSSDASEESTRHNLNWTTQPGPMVERHINTRRSSSDEFSNESRHETSTSNLSERSHNQRDQHDTSVRASRTATTEDVMELTEDVSLMAVGPDFSQPDRMYTNWRSDPANRDSSLAIDMVNLAMPALSRVIEQGVSHRRMEARARRGDDLHPDFWSEAEQLVARYNPLAYGRRVVLEHDGALNPILPADIAAAIQQTRAGLGQLTGRSHFLPGR